MKSLLLLSWLVCAADAPADGTLIFLENCNSLVEFSTRGEIGHVAVVLRDGDAAWVYEATPAQVRRAAVDEYYAELSRLNERRRANNQVRVWAQAPLTAYSEEEVGKMREYLDSQLGRRYSVKNYVVGQPGDGVHCAELAASTLNRSGRFSLKDCQKLHPTALYQAVQSQHSPRVEVELPSPASETWCVRAQRRWDGWFTWCGWSCREAWSFCW